MKQEHEMTPGVLVSGEVLSAGDARARVAVLEDEVAELRGRVCVPDGYAVVPSAVVEFLKGAGALEGLWFGESGIDRGAFWWRKYLFAAAPAPVERVEREAVRSKVARCIGMRPGMGEVTVKVEDGIVSGWLDPGCTVYIYATPQPAPTACTGKNCGSTDPKLHSADCFAEHEQAITPTAAQGVSGLPFARKILEKLERFRECAEDDEGVDIGRNWLDMLTHLGLLNRVQRSPARWEMTAQADDALEAAHQSGGAK